MKPPICRLCKQEHWGHERHLFGADTWPKVKAVAKAPVTLTPIKAFVYASSASRVTAHLDDVTKTVTETPVSRKPGRPKKANALTPAERKQRQRAKGRAKA